MLILLQNYGREGKSDDFIFHIHINNKFLKHITYYQQHILFATVLLSINMVDVSAGFMF